MPKTPQTLTVQTLIDDEVFRFDFGFTNPAQINQVWGNISSQVAQEGAMGEHSSAHGTFTPDPFPDPHTSDPSRDGVGNVSKNRFEPPGTEEGTGDALAGGAQGLHGALQGALLGTPGLPPTSIEAEIGPLFPEEPHGNVTVVVIDPLAI